MEMAQSHLARGDVVVKYGAMVQFQDTELNILPSGCMYLSALQTLVVSDMHLEKGASLTRNSGQMLPPYDTRSTLEALSMEIDRFQPERVISLGDSFHDRKAAEGLSRENHDMLVTLMQGREWVWISGNHDPEPPKGLGGECMDELNLGALHFRHEPKSDALPGEISGHLHPAASLRQRGRQVRRKCFAGDTNRLIMPSFGAYAGGLCLTHQAFEGLFDKTSLKVWMLSGRNVYEIAARQIAC